MYREILMKGTPEELSVAVIDNQQLSEIYFERLFKNRLIGNIYKGHVDSVLPVCRLLLLILAWRKTVFCM